MSSRGPVNCDDMPYETGNDLAGVSARLPKARQVPAMLYWIDTC